MNTPNDVIKYINKHFSKDQWPLVLSMIESAVIDDGSPAGPRLQRCVLVGSGNTLDGVKHLIEMLKHDYRDVIMSGEYEYVKNGKDRRKFDLYKPIPDNVG